MIGFIETSTSHNIKPFFTYNFDPFFCSFGRQESVVRRKVRGSHFARCLADEWWTHASVLQQDSGLHYLHAVNLGRPWSDTLVLKKYEVLSAKCTNQPNKNGRICHYLSDSAISFGWNPGIINCGGAKPGVKLLEFVGSDTVRTPHSLHLICNQKCSKWWGLCANAISGHFW